MITLLQFSLLIFIAWLIKFIYKIFFHPYITAKKYKQYGCVPMPYAGAGLFKYFENDLKAHGDALYSSRQAVRENPNLKAICSNIGPRIILFINDPEAIKEVLSNPQLYPKSSAFRQLFKQIASRGLVAAEGGTWKRHRKLISQSFHFEFLKQMIPQIGQISDLFMDKMASNKTVDLLKDVQQITAETVAKVFFGNQFEGKMLQGMPLTQLTQEIASKTMQYSIEPVSVLLGRWVINYGLLKRYRDLKRDVTELRSFCQEMINQRKQLFQGEKSASKQKYLIDILIETQNSPNPEEQISDEELIDEYIVFFIAGMDTTAQLIATTIYHFTQHPEYLERARKEIDELLPPKIEESTMDDLNKLEFMYCIMKESLRLTSPAPFMFSRELSQDKVIGGIPVKKGWSISTYMYLNSVNSKYFENPEEYNPDRWVDPQQLEIVKKNPFIFVPFSAGPRNCIGQHLALIEAKIILAKFIKRFDFSIPKDYKFGLKWHFVLEPAEKLAVTLEEKKS